MRYEDLRHISKGDGERKTRYDLPQSKEMQKALKEHQKHHDAPEWDGKTLTYAGRMNDFLGRR